MNRRWPVVPLRSVAANAQTGPFGSQLHSDEYIDNGIPVINPSNIISGKLVPDPLVTVNEATARRLSCHALVSGDLIFARRGELGRAAVVGDEAVGWLCGTGSLRVRTRSGVLDSRFAGYVLQSAPTRSYFELEAVGSTMGNLNTAIVLGLPIPLPLAEGQQQIADFLDVETARIDALIAKKYHMAELLSERRAGCIEQEIRSLADQYGELRLKVVAADVNVGIVITPAAWYQDDGVPALRGLNVKPGRISGDDLVFLSAEGDRINRKSSLRAGDVVVVRTGQAGAAAVVPPEFDGANCIDLIIIKPGLLDPEYLTFVLNSDWTQKHIRQHSVGTIQAHFNVGTMAELPLPVPSRKVQQTIVHRLSERTGILDEVRYRLNRQIGLLQERRQALITAAVTGELEVRERVRVDA